MRALRDLPPTVSDLPRARRRDGLAARPHLPDAGGGRGQGGAEPDLPAPSRPLSRLSRVRNRVPVGREVRLAPRGDARGAPSRRAAGEASTAPGVRLLGLSRAGTAGRGSRALQALQALRAASARAGDRRAATAAAARGDGSPPRGRSRGGAAPGICPRPRPRGRASRAPDGLRPAPPLPGCEPGHGSPPRAGRLRSRDPQVAGLLRCPRASRRASGCPCVPRARARQRVFRRPRFRRHQRRGLRRGDEGVRPSDSRARALRRARARCHGSAGRRRPAARAPRSDGHVPRCLSPGPRRASYSNASSRASSRPARGWSRRRTRAASSRSPGGVGSAVWT